VQCFLKNTRMFLHEEQTCEVKTCGASHVTVMDDWALSDILTVNDEYAYILALVMDV
jgi:hypothetical protein